MAQAFLTCRHGEMGLSQANSVVVVAVTVPKQEQSQFLNEVIRLACKALAGRAARPEVPAAKNQTALYLQQLRTVGAGYGLRLVAAS